MRKRINKSVFVGSSDKQRIVEWRQELEENHVKNSSTFMVINQTVQVKPKTSLELFEENLKRNKMKRVITILGTLCTILLVVTLLTIQALVDMSSRASYHMQDADKAHQAMEAIMDRIHEDNPDYYLYVLIETDAYMLYQESTRVLKDNAFQ